MPRKETFSASDLMKGEGDPKYDAATELDAAQTQQLIEVDEKARKLREQWALMHATLKHAKRSGPVLTTAQWKTISGYTDDELLRKVELGEKEWMKDEQFHRGVILEIIERNLIAEPD